MRGFLTILPVVAVMAAGWLLRRFDKVDKGGLDQINSVLFWLVMPALLFRAGIGLDREVFYDPSYPAVLYGAFSVVVALVFFAVRLLGIPRKRAAVSVLGAVRSNVVFIGLPLSEMLMGDKGVEALTVYLSVGMLFYNTVPMACSQMVMEGRFSIDAMKKALVGALRTPLIIAGAAGVLLSLIGASRFIPLWASQGLDLICACGSGMALIAIGASLNLEGLIPSMARSWGDMAVKLFLLPAVVWAGFYLFPARDPFLGRMSVLISAMSPAFNTFIVAHGMGMDSSYAADYIVTSTVVGILSVALWIELLF